MNAEEFRKKVLSHDGAELDEQGVVIIDSLAALEVITFLHQTAPEEMASLDRSANIYDFESFVEKLLLAGVLE